jgi:hypothetical protein
MINHDEKEEIPNEPQIFQCLGRGTDLKSSRWLVDSLTPFPHQRFAELSLSERANSTSSQINSRRHSRVKDRNEREKGRRGGQLLVKEERYHESSRRLERDIADRFGHLR